MDKYNERALPLNRTHMSRFLRPLLFFFVGELLGLATEKIRIASNTSPGTETHSLRHNCNHEMENGVARDWDMFSTKETTSKVNIYHCFN